MIKRLTSSFHRRLEPGEQGEERRLTDVVVTEALLDQVREKESDQMHDAYLRMSGK